MTWLWALLLVGACASSDQDRGSGGGLPRATQAFRAYAAVRLDVPEDHIGGGPRNEAEASLYPQRVGAIWAIEVFHLLEPEMIVRGWATSDGRVITIDRDLGVLLLEAGVWGGGVMAAVTASDLADRLSWSLGMNHQVFVNTALGVPAPELHMLDGAGAMSFVDDLHMPGPGGAGGGPHDLTRFDIALTADHTATATATPLPNPQQPGSEPR